MGGSRHSNCSVLEAIEHIEEMCDRKLNYKFSDSSRSGDHVWWISDTRKFQSDYPEWNYRYDLQAIFTEIVEATNERQRSSCKVSSTKKQNELMKLSVVIPARNEASCIAKTVRVLSAHLEAEQIDHEILVVDDGSTDNTRAVVCQISEDNPSVQYINNSGPHGFGLAVRRGLERYTGDAVAIYMADGSDRPEDLVQFLEVMRSKDLDCVFGSRFVRGAKVVDYPFLKLGLNRMANWFIRLLFGLRYNDITNAFKLYRRHVIDGLQPFLSHHFNLTVELPLKAIVRGYTYSVVPNDWINRKTGVSKLKVQEMGSRYLFIVLYCFIEKWLSKKDYHRQALERTNEENGALDVTKLNYRIELTR
jgi:dolichol-phosphate mannosyltransferase